MKKTAVFTAYIPENYEFEDEKVTIVRKANNSISCDLTTTCKRYKTAINRLVKEIKKHFPEADVAEEGMMEMCGNGVFSFHEKGVVWAYDIEAINEDQYYISIWCEAGKVQIDNGLKSEIGPFFGHNTEKAAEKPAKRVRRRNRQMVKAYKLYVPTINKQIKELGFNAFDNSPLNSYLVNHAPEYYYKSFAQYRYASKEYHFSKEHTRFYDVA